MKNFGQELDTMIDNPTDDLRLMRQSYYAANEMLQYVKERKSYPDFFTVERSFFEGDTVKDTNIALYNFVAVGEALRSARIHGFAHLCIMAHWMLPGGRGDCAVTLFLEDTVS